MKGLSLGVLDETLKVMAFWMNRKSPLQCDQTDMNNRNWKRNFCRRFAKYGDLIANLVVFEEFILRKKKENTNKLKSWCKENLFNYYALCRSYDNLTELQRLTMNKINKVGKALFKKPPSNPMENEREEIFKKVNEAFFSGYYEKTATFVSNKMCIWIHKFKINATIDS